MDEHLQRMMGVPPPPSDFDRGRRRPPLHPPPPLPPPPSHVPRPPPAPPPDALQQPSTSANSTSGPRQPQLKIPRPKTSAKGASKSVGAKNLTMSSSAGKKTSLRDSPPGSTPARSPSLEGRRAFYFFYRRRPYSFLQ
ncbi:sulfated surface glycoprotein 185-like [Ischnura elegans]|uniref:sulfated surface glycoprotein 185-like n=1 Tax=Ischnura elegans TaxID=197161 RepID=UPI001ED89E33|nr:sulfated surface glycoprotein 185-like [Ischnura elegans]